MFSDRMLGTCSCIVLIPNFVGHFRTIVRPAISSTVVACVMRIMFSLLCRNELINVEVRIDGHAAHNVNIVCRDVDDINV